ncbi:Pentatricopeptide repeat-containing protein [Artemisia annua]|uniref:Pentatricopeptide repeat-containing protein n=1 Tax=Artemisia annua TaxID=35608 RepID=A0A2U1P1X3_ARTAN|nr:Pentatricopeptide repeat-containing protein [Artemisia annua]
MLLHPTLSQSPSHPKQPISISSSSFTSSLKVPSGFNLSPFKKPQFVIKSSFSKVHSYGTVDYEKKPGTSVTWKAIYKRISLMGDPEKGATQVLNQWENEGKKVTKWELCRIVKEMRKYGRHKLALEIYQWMNNRPERFRISSSDAAIQLDLVSKVNGISGAEDYFNNLPNNLMDKRIYGALLNAYVRARMVEKAESLLVEMKKKDYATHALPFNVMMTLYMNLKDQEKVEALVSEMMQSNIDLDLYSYNIWISSRGSQGSIEKMEEAYEKLIFDESVNPNWTTHSTMATLYIKNSRFDKAEDCLRKIETLITGRDRIPYHYLLSHYGSIGKKDEVKRIWESYKTIFPYIPNLGYSAVISSFIRMDDIEEAELLYEEWVSMKTSYDPRIGNLLLGWYVRNGFTEKAETFLKEMLNVGKSNSSTWEIIAESHIKESRISDALSCLEKALAEEGSSFWRPKPMNISVLYNLCERENDEKSKEALLEVLRKVGVLEDDMYMSFLPFYTGSKAENVKS